MQSGLHCLTEGQALVTFFQKVFISCVIAMMTGVGSAQAEDESLTVATGYLFTDFDFMASDEPVANWSTNFDAPLQLRGNLWVQTGIDTDWTEVDLTFSTQTVNLGPAEFGAMGGIYYLPYQDDDTIYTLQLSAGTDVWGFGLGALYQWYWEDLEDELFQVSVSRTVSVWQQPVDVEVGQSWLQSGAESNYVVIGTPVRVFGHSARLFTKHSWGTGDGHPPVFGITFE